MSTLFQDLRYALRTMLKRPGFNLIAVVTLALGIGSNAAIFSLVSAVLLRPLPLSEPERLMTFWHSAPLKGLKEVDLNDAQFAYYRDRTHTFESIAAYEDSQFVLSGNGNPEVVVGARVTFNYFDVLGRQPLYGRAFL
ncbi:MAG TPA: ABC transporter permease, partial [Pyrinomonadaceae bacterium]|nr:ABC transporter permease [Pyrinomonadaceae bacterium]